MSAPEGPNIFIASFEIDLLPRVALVIMCGWSKQWPKKN
jgi:hypothetical protein